MARGRLISKSLGSSRKFHALLTAGGKLGEFCQVLFPLLIANTDDFGRLPGDAFTIKNVVLPSSRRPEEDFERALEIIHQAGLLARYVVDDSIYLQIHKFDEHQPNLHKRLTSKFPEIPETPGDSGKLRPNLIQSNLTQFKRTQNPEGNPEPCLPALVPVDLFAEFWANYPKKKAKETAQRAWNKRRPNSDLHAVILRALERQKASPDWQKDSGRYIPLPATWLNHARWTDELEVDIATGQVSEVTRHNLAASEAAEQIILENERRRTHGHRG